MKIDLTERQLILLMALLESARDNKTLANNQVPVVYDILKVCQKALGIGVTG